MFFSFFKISIRGIGFCNLLKYRRLFQFSDTISEHLRHIFGTLVEQFRNMTATKKERLRNSFVAFYENRHK